MQFTLSPEEQEFQLEVRAFIEKNYTSIEGNAYVKFQHWLQALVERGWYTHKWPK